MSIPQILNNELLSWLTPEVRNAWFPKLKKVDLTVGVPISHSVRRMEHVYFPVDCIIAVVNVIRDGSSLSTAMIGREGLLGVDTILDNGQVSSTAVTQASIQASGTAYRLPATELTRSFNTCPELRSSLLRYTLTLIRQTEQTSACNRHHSIDQQLFRWILLSLDRLQTDTLIITQEHIAQLLGVRREGINEAAGRLQRAGVIEYSRGKIRVQNRMLLEDQACGCYIRPVKAVPCSSGGIAGSGVNVSNPVFAG